MHTVSELIREVRELPPADLEEFFSKVEAMRPSGASNGLSKQETSLLAKINSRLPNRRLARWNYLIALRDATTIETDEYKELLLITEEIEQFDAERLGWIAQLADLHGLSLRETFDRYNIQPSTNE